MASVDVKQLGKSFGATTVLQKLDLSIRSGEFLVLVGPSGCGKSTLLRLVAGLEEATSGEIFIDGAPVNDRDPKDRGVAMVFQNYALYPHMTVKQNMAFSLKLAKIPPAEIERRVAEAARVLGLDGLLARKPGQLSGGQKQRVAMGRAMVRQPKVFLFDEPLSNLDAQLRVKMRSEISLLHRRLKATSIYVTHDQVEAMTLADRIAVMYGGRLEQIGTPLEVYHGPRTRFVASFIGTPAMNFLPAEFFPRVALAAGTTSVGFRPEMTEVTKNASAGEHVLSLGPGKVMLVEPLGTMAHVHVAIADHRLVAEMKTADAPALETPVCLRLQPDRLFYFDRDGQRVPA